MKMLSFKSIFLVRVFATTSIYQFPRAIRTVPRSLEEYQKLWSAEKVNKQKPEGRVVRVAFVGDPNVGKSTLTNRLLGKELCSVSRKAHTTRGSNKLTYIEDDLQVVFVDTPGIVNKFHAKKHSLPDNMINSPGKVVSTNKEIDVLAVVVDASDHWRRDFLSEEVYKVLKKHRERCDTTCSILVLNKTDLLKSKRKLLSCVETLTGGVVDGKPISAFSRDNTVVKQDLKAKIWAQYEDVESKEKENSAETEDTAYGKINPYEKYQDSWQHFERVFMVSARDNDGIDDLREFFKQKSKPRIWDFSENVVTEQNPMDIVKDIVREKLLDNLQNEIPYVVDIRVQTWNVDESNNLLLTVSIEGKQDRHVRHILGPQGKFIRKITQQVRQKLCNVFLCDVGLKIAVVKK